jgi:predicted dehydrogenase/aryl-alcohol dehydrogenase-like predicted oxidoreductase
MADQGKLRWGIIGPGGIAKAFYGGILHSETAELVAIASRNPTKPGLATDFGGVRIHDGYDAILADPEVDAVYIATPHTFHAEWAIKAAEAGKHVLAEKPMGLTAFEADAMFHAAQKAKTFMGEAFMYRLHPQTLRLVELIKAGRIGEVRLIRSSFGFALPKFMPEHRLYANDLAGGAILDVGGYPVSMTRLIAGAALGQHFAEPIKVAGTAHLGAEGTDEWASALLTFPNDIIGEVSGSISLAQDNVLRIFGTTGRIEVENFWFASGRQGGTGKITIIPREGEPEIVEIEEPRWLYSFEVDAVTAAVRGGQQEFAWPGMGWQDSLGNLRVLDKWRQSVGLEYNSETSAKKVNTISGRALGPNGKAIAKRSIPGVSKPASIVAMGFEDFKSFSSGSIMLDAFWQAGGNLFDTAYVYGAGYTEKLLGEWQKNRGVRNDMLIIGKGAHSPLCYPDMIGKQLTQTLDRLQTDHVDIYFMHRDNPDVPVGEFVDAMDAEVKAGRIKGPFGGSNWSRERMDEAIAYAERAGKQKPGALSNNFALADMLDPVWAGCVAAAGPEWKQWLIDRQIPNFSWSSQARGFFTDRAGRDKTGNEELVRCWYSDANFGRRDRAIELANRLGKKPIHVALAYVLAQPFPSIPLIGPRTLGELEDSMQAFDIELSPEDLRWLANG